MLAFPTACGVEGGDVGAVVSEAEQHPHQRHAVADAVVHPRHDRRAVAEVVDVVEAPERPREVELRRHLPAHVVLQLLLAGGLGEGHANQMMVKVDLGRMQPGGPADAIVAPHSSPKSIVAR